MQALSDKTVFITGAAGGIGFATATRAATQGASVILTDIDAGRAEHAAEQLRSAGHDVTSAALDVTSDQAWHAAFDSCVTPRGGLDVLVNNAGLTRDRTILKMSEEDWAVVLDVHLRGAWLGSRHAIPAMRSRGGGAIISVSSDARHGSFGQANYAAAKAGIVALMRTVALEHAKDNIRANCVAPGPVDTQMLASVPQHVIDGWLQNIPLKRLASADDIANVITFLASDAAAYITGHVIPIDGGATQP